MSAAKTVLSVIGKVLLIFMALVVAVVLVTVFPSEKKSKSDTSKTEEAAQEVVQESAPEEAPQEEAAPEPQEQVLFDGDTMRVVYKDWREEDLIEGACYLYLDVENKTGSEVWFHPAADTSSVNGYNGLFMQGLPTYVQPGNKAVMGIILTYTQFNVTSFDEVHSCDFELVQEDKNNFGTEFARAHIHLER